MRKDYQTRSLATALLVVACVLAGAATAGAQDASRIEALEREVRELRTSLQSLRAAAPADARLAEIERRIEVLARELEALRTAEAVPAADTTGFGLGPAASKVYRVERGVSIGGYGEMLYESISSRRDDDARSGRTDTADFLRGVVYLGYKFDDRFLLNTELEFEHASTGKGGEASVEFAYLDWRASEAFGLRGGLVLLPMGLVNELHEPTTYLSARRPGVEQAIIPTTWRENGLGVFGDLGPLTYRAYVVAGLDASRFAASGLRSGRQSGGRSKSEDVGLAARLDYTGAPGLLAGVSAYVSDSGQGLRDEAGRDLDVRTSIVDAHLDWRWRGLEARALAARAAVGEAGALSRALGLTGSAAVGERLEGGYVQVGYDVLARGGGRAGLLPFARFERYDTQARVAAGFARSGATDVEVTTIGVAFRPLDQLILKLDWQDVDNAAGTGVDQVNLALGYVF